MTRTDAATLFTPYQAGIIEYLRSGGILHYGIHEFTRIPGRKKPLDTATMRALLEQGLIEQSPVPGRLGGIWVLTRKGRIIDP